MIGLPQEFLSFSDGNSKGGGVMQVQLVSLNIKLQQTNR